MAHKLQDRPLPPGIVIARPMVDGILEAAFKKPLVVVNAGAGFGKTTAVSQYLTKTGYRTVWFTFAPADGVPARFWEHLTRVFAQHRPTLGEKMQLLGFPETLQSFNSFLVDLTEELYQDDMTVAFVFDDAHLMGDPLVKDFIANLVAARLENSYIILLTRVWPIFDQPLPVVPQVVGAASLRFTLDETVEYLLDAGLKTGRGTAERVHHYVSGWPIALSLVALAMLHGQLGSIAGGALVDTKPSLYALFEQEIFSQYTPSEQDLLVKLSLLDSFPRGLVQAVTGERERDLGQLLNNNIFIGYDADSMRLSFRPLYHEFLREKRQSVRPDELNETYRRAARWCRDNGYYYDAARYYSQCGDHEDLWRTLLCIDATHHNKNEADFYIEQIKALPAGFKKQNPMTGILLSAMLINNLRFTETEELLDEVEQLLGQDGPGAETSKLQGEYLIAKGFLTLAKEQNGFEQHFKKAAELLPEGSSRWTGRLQLIDLGPGLNLQSAKAGELKKSLACFTEGVPYMVRVLHGTARGLDKLCESEALFLTGELKKAAVPAYQALYDAHAAAQYDIVGNALFILLRIYMATGNYDQVLDTLEHVERYEHDREAQHLGIWDIIRAWLYAEVDDVERVALWIRNPVQKGFAPISVDRPMLVRLRCLIAAGQYSEALALLGQFEAFAKSKGAVITLIYATLNRAVTHNYLGNTGEAVAALKETYALAKGNRIFMPIIEYGSRTRSLLEHARQTVGHGIPKAWLDETYAKASTCAKYHAYLISRYRQAQESLQTDYSLSPRETELLNHLSQGLTRDEMAEAMQLSINTVKSITKQVFAKLGAVNAAHAVRIAIVNQLI